MSEVAHCDGEDVAEQNHLPHGQEVKEKKQETGVPQPHSRVCPPMTYDLLLGPPSQSLPPTSNSAEAWRPLGTLKIQTIAGQKRQKRLKSNKVSIHCCCCKRPKETRTNNEAALETEILSHPQLNS